VGRLVEGRSDEEGGMVEEGGGDRIRSEVGEVTGRGLKVRAGGRGSNTRCR
jgi:hypothetical protein